MGFISGVIVGIAVAAGAAAWYMSRAGSEFRDRYRVDRRLGDSATRSRSARATSARRSATQVEDVRTQVDGPGGRDALGHHHRVGSGDGHARRRTRRRPAEEAAELAADVEAKAAKVKRAAKDEASSARSRRPH